jgi:predicted dehydrogenase
MRMNPPDRRSVVTGIAGSAALALAAELDPAAALPRLAARREPIRVGIVGCGRQGRAILAELAKIEHCQVVGVCDVVESRVQSGQRRAQGARGFAEASAMLGELPELEAVVVATPTHLHRGVVEAALAAGKHVYCEAPLASSEEDARAIARAARAARAAGGGGAVFASGLAARSNPVYALARSFYQTGVLRQPAVLRAQSHKKTSWRNPPGQGESDAAANWRLDPAVSLGLEGELGAQQLDVFHWFLGAYPVHVRGSGALLLHRDGRELPDSVRLALGFASGLELHYSATLANSYEGTYEVIAGEMASIRLAWNAGWMFKEADSPTQGWEVYANRQSFHDEQGITLIADATKLAAQNKLKEGVGLPEPPLYYPLVDFLKAVAEGTPVACSAEEGFRATLVAILAHQAVSSGEQVAIDPARLEV